MRTVSFALAICFMAAMSCTNNVNAPVGDRALFQVKGNVESITFQSEGAAEMTFLNPSPYFNQEGLYFMNGEEYKQTNNPDGSRSLLFEDEGDGYTDCNYDSKGRLTGITWWESSLSDIQYDNKDRIVSYIVNGTIMMELSQVYTFSYKKDNNPVSVTIVTKLLDSTLLDDNSAEMEMFKNLPQEDTYTYEYLAIDNQGNWTERKRNDGVVEKRTIKYLP